MSDDLDPAPQQPDASAPTPEQLPADPGVAPNPGAPPAGSVPEPVSPAGDSIGERIDARIQEFRDEVNGRIDAVQAQVAELSAKLDARQNQGQSQ